MTVRNKYLQITRIKSISELETYHDAWHMLAAGAPMRSPEWLLTWWEIYGTADDKLWILRLCNPEGDLVGLAPLYLQDARGKATLRLLGSANDFTHHTNWITAPGYEAQVGKEVARFLIRNKSEWERLLFEAVDADAGAILATIKYLAEKSFLYHKRQIHSVWKIALPETWDKYLMMLSRSHRKRCRKLQRLFFDSGKIHLHLAEDEAGLREGFAVLLKLHGARWGSAKQPLGVFTDQKFQKFHKKISRKLLARKQLRLAWLEYEGKPLAVEYQFFDSKTVYAYQAGVDLSKNDFSPGRLSMMAAIQFAITRGCKFFDLLRGNEPYKKNWRAAPADCFDIRLWQDRLSGRMAWALWHGYTTAARYLKPILPPGLINMVLSLLQALRKAGGPYHRRGN
jgi:CelD/BcsL family acetyltransferase involved in cellulose biosynthesis